MTETTHHQGKITNRGQESEREREREREREGEGETTDEREGGKEKKVRVGQVNKYIYVQTKEI